MNYAAMAHQDLNDLLAFLAVARERSFTRAAAKLGVVQSTLSHTIKRLESQMGLRLLTRTTRSVGLTEAGERLRQSVAPRLDEIERDIAALMSLRDTPSGTIRITLSDHALDKVVWPKLWPVLAQYPEIRVEFSLDTAFRNIVEDGFDAGVRLGERVEKDMIAVRIGPDWRLVAVASPAYLKAHARPKHPKDLVHHVCIKRREAAGGHYAWEFAKNGPDLRVRVEGQLTFNESRAMIDAALKGFGIAYLPEDMVTEQISSGELLVVLDEWSPKFDGYFIYFPTSRQNSAAFKIIVDALRYRPPHRRRGSSR
jgi:DNA-binding transcriptional LysR family regulator